MEEPFIDMLLPPQVQLEAFKTIVDKENEQEEDASGNEQANSESKSEKDGKETATTDGEPNVEHEQKTEEAEGGEQRGEEPAPAGPEATEPAASETKEVKEDEERVN
jgi:hypothetical protein